MAFTTEEPIKEIRHLARESDEVQGLIEHELQIFSRDSPRPNQIDLSTLENPLTPLTRDLTQGSPPTTRKVLTVLGRKILRGVFQQWLKLRQKYYCVKDASVYVEIEGPSTCKIELRITELGTTIDLANRCDYKFLLKVLDYPQFGPTILGFWHLTQEILEQNHSGKYSTRAILNHPAILSPGELCMTIQGITEHMYKLEEIRNVWVDPFARLNVPWKTHVQQAGIVSVTGRLTRAEADLLQIPVTTIHKKNFDSVFGSIMFTRHMFNHIKPAEKPDEVSLSMFMILEDAICTSLNILHKVEIELVEQSIGIGTRARQSQRLLKLLEGVNSHFHY